MAAWINHLNSQGYIMSHCLQSKKMFDECNGVGWTYIPGNYRNEVRQHYRRFHATEQDLTLVEDRFTGWYIVTDDPSILDGYKVNRTQDDISRITTQARNLDISVVRNIMVQRYGSVNGDRLTEDFRRLIYDLENLPVL